MRYWILFLKFLVTQVIYLYIYITHMWDQNLKLKDIRIQKNHLVFNLAVETVVFNSYNELLNYLK